MKKFLHEFREFAARGNVIDLAVGLSVGAAFNKIVTSLVNDIIMPPLGVILGKVDFTSLYINLSGQTITSIADAKKAGQPVIAYGLFLNTVLEFIIIAFAIFLIIKQVNRLKNLRTPKAMSPTTKVCPHCDETISIKATRCPKCTSQLGEKK